MKEPGLNSLDPTLCISASAREHLESLPWRAADAFSQAGRKYQAPLDSFAEGITVTLPVVDD